jgi:Peptidase M15
MTLLKQQKLQGQGTLAGAAAPVEEKTSTILSPNEAYDLIQQEKIMAMKLSPMSKYYIWGDFFRTENPEEAELSSMGNGVKLAYILDKLSEKVGYKVKINSWNRTKKHQLKIYGYKKNTPLGSRHIVGDGVDIQVGSDKSLLYRTLRSMPEIRRIGYPTNGSGFLHIDLMNNSPSDEQQIFVDNGTIHSNFRNVKIIEKGTAINYVA